jgi:hypothetical protein
MLFKKWTKIFNSRCDKLKRKNGKFLDKADRPFKKTHLRVGFVVFFLNVLFLGFFGWGFLMPTVIFLLPFN